MTEVKDNLPADASVAAPVETKTEAPIENKTLAQGADAKATENPKTIAADFPEDWREKIADKNDKELERLKRFGSVKDIYKSFRNLETKLSSGQMKSSVPPDAKPEELALWRKENGIPEKPEDYKIELGDGLVLGDNDKPVTDEFVKFAHSRNIPPSIVNEIVGWWMKGRVTEQEKMAQEDAQFRIDSTVALRTELGNDFHSTTIMSKNFLERLPEDVRNMIAGSRYDGKVLGDHPQFVTAMAQLESQLNPIATVTGVTQTDKISGLLSEKESIEKKMGTVEYKSDKVMQRRYLDLTQMLQNVKLPTKAA